MELDEKVKLEYPAHWWTPEALEMAKTFIDPLPIKLVHSGRSNDISQIYASQKQFHGIQGLQPIIIFHVSYGRIVAEGLEKLGEAGYAARYIVDGGEYGKDDVPASTLEIIRLDSKKFANMYITNSNRFRNG